MHRLLAEVPNLAFSISYTTRSPRGVEKEGEDYHYVSRDDFEQRIGRSEFLEYAQVFGNYYGTHRGVLEKAAGEGKDLILDIDVQGARQLKVALPEAVTVFILPPSRAILEQRLRARSVDSDAVIERRLRGAAEEVRNYGQYDYVLINNDLEVASANLQSVVRAERVRRQRVEQDVRPILESFESL